MKPSVVNFINGLILIIVGLYGYFGVTSSTGTASVTALIPAAFGLLLVILSSFWNKAPKVISHIAIVLTLLLIIMVVNRFVKIDVWNETKYIFLICIISNAFALFVFIRSFINARIRKWIHISKSTNISFWRNRHVKYIIWPIPGIIESQCFYLWAL